MTALLPHCLTTVARLEAKQSSARPPFYATIANSPVGCAFWGSDKCRLSAPCLSFIFNQAACLLHPTKPYRGINFPYQHFLSAAYLDATELFQSWISEVLQS